MLSSRRKTYCVFGCAELGKSYTEIVTIIKILYDDQCEQIQTSHDSACAYMHRFPHPERRPEIFTTWMSIVRDRLQYTDPVRVYKNKRICDYHFRPEDKVACHRITASAIPCLHLNGVFTSPGIAVQLEHNYFIPGPNPSMEHSVDATPTQLPSNEALHHLNPDLNNHPSTSQVHADAALHRLSPDMSNHPSTSQVHAVAGLGRKSLAATIKSVKSLQKANRRLKNRLRKSAKKEMAYRTRLAGAEKAFAGKAFSTVTKHMSLPGRIFTAIQYRQAIKKTKGRRYNFEEKVLALSLYKKSPKCYSMLSKYFTLPCAKSLRNLLSQIKLTPGTNKIIFEKMKETVSELNEEDKLCCLMFDEMSVSPSIHFNETKDELKGFISTAEDLKIASHVLVFMVKGIKSNYKQPVAYYFTESIKKIELKSIIVEVVRSVQATGLTIVSTVCDQGAANVGAIKSLLEDTKAAYHRKGVELRREVFEVDGHKIVPLFDVPHLIKGLRNNLLTKDLTYTDIDENNKSKTVKWEYFQMLYEADKSYKELRFVPKLTEEHVNPEKIKKMRVKMAAQVFSRSVAAAARHMVNLGDLPQECAQLIPFVLMIDQLFDSLNAGSFHTINGKEYRTGVKRNSPHHKLWEKGIKFLKTVKYLQKRKCGNKIVLIETVAPSVTNLIKTIEGMQALWITLSQKYSLDVMLTRHFNQDPIENFFGNVRSLGVRNVSPDCRAFEAAFKTLLLNNYSSPQALNANCEADYDNCLQNLDFFMKEQSNSTNSENMQNTNLEISQRMYDTLYNVSVDDPSKHQQRMYVCGWVLKKCLKKIVKACSSCRNTILSNRNNTGTDFIRAKEYHANKQWLCYPSDQLANCFNEIQDIATAYLKTSLQKFNNKQNITMLVDSFVVFPFDCNVHREKLKEYFINITINILIYSWCRSVNRILQGKINYNEGPEDPIKQSAQIYYNKHKHRRKEN